MKKGGKNSSFSHYKTGLDLDLPSDLIERIWQLADPDGRGHLSYSQFARKFSSYSATSSLTSLKPDMKELDAHDTYGRRANVVSPTSVRKNAIRMNATVFRVEDEEYDQDIFSNRAKSPPREKEENHPPREKGENQRMTVTQLARTGKYLATKDVETMTADELRY